MSSSIQQLTALDALARLADQDATLFSIDPAIQETIKQRLGWVALASKSEANIELCYALADEALNRELTDVVLLGMGGSSLAAFVIANVLGSEQVTLHVLDTTDPEEISDHLGRIDFETTYVIVASKSGTTLEPVALGDLFFEIACEQLGSVEAAADRFIAITDPDTELALAAHAQGWRHVILADPTVGGRFSALSLFGLVPSALIGVDCERIIESAYRMEVTCTSEEAFANPAAELASFMHDAYREGRDKLMIVLPKRYKAFGLWLCQLIAESLGKNGSGIVPIVTNTQRQGEHIGADQMVVILRDDDDDELSLYGERMEHRGPVAEYVLGDAHDIGGEFVRWEFATALAGLLMGINPFDEPDVARAKQATNEYLDGTLHMPEIPTVDSLSEYVTDGSYIALLSYVHRCPERQRELGELAGELMRAFNVPVSIEYGPRYLHSTGQLHKGGPDRGVFIVIGDDELTGINLALPHRDFTLRELFNAQRHGDIASLVATGKRVVVAQSVDEVRGVL